MKIEEIINLLYETREETKEKLKEIVNESVDENYPEEERTNQKLWHNTNNEYVIAVFYDNILKKLLARKLNNGNGNT